MSLRQIQKRIAELAVRCEEITLEIDAVRGSKASHVLHSRRSTDN